MIYLDKHKSPISKIHIYILYSSYKNITSTWPTFMPNFLGIQIDHILFSNNFKMVDKKTSNSFGSVHRPLIVELSY